MDALYRNENPHKKQKEKELLESNRKKILKNLRKLENFKNNQMNNDNNVSDLLNTDHPNHINNSESYENTNFDGYDSPTRVSIMDKVRLRNLFLFFDRFI